MSGKDASVLPPGWAFVPLGAIGEWRGGGTPSKHNAEYWLGGNIPWVSPKDMKRFRIDDAEDHITQSALETSVKLVPERSVLMVTRSGILVHTFPVAISLVPVTVNQDMKALTPLASVDPFYIGYSLAAFGQSILHDCSKDGTTVASVETDALKNYQIPVAPSVEQERVVQAIESYLSRLDDAVATLERVQRNLKRYRASVLKAAVEGRLVPTEAKLARKEGRDYEPADVLLARILEERKARWIKQESEKGRCRAEAKTTKAGKPWTKADDQAALAKARAAAAKNYQEPARPDTNELPGLPEGWCWATIEQMAIVSGGLTKNSKRESLPIQVPYLRVANVYSDELRLDEIKTIGVAPGEQQRVTLELGDLLVVEGNGSIDQIGRVAIWDGSIKGCTHQNHLIKVRLTEVALGRWCLQWLLSPAGRGHVVKQASSTSGLHTLSISKVEGLVVPLCPRGELDRIASEVDRLLTIAEASDGYAGASRLRASRLRQSVLKWAFDGKLVDQDPNDEPASVLLERIKAEREKAQAVAKAKKKPGRAKRKKKSA